jgi:hypothetical protein
MILNPYIIIFYDDSTIYLNRKKEEFERILKNA